MCLTTKPLLNTLSQEDIELIRKGGPGRRSLAKLLGMEDVYSSLSMPPGTAFMFSGSDDRLSMDMEWQPSLGRKYSDDALGFALMGIELMKVRGATTGKHRANYPNPSLIEYGLRQSTPGVTEAQEVHRDHFFAISEAYHGLVNMVQETDAYVEEKEQWEECRRQYVENNFSGYYANGPQQFVKSDRMTFAKQNAEEAFEFLNPAPVCPHPKFYENDYENIDVDDFFQKHVLPGCTARFFAEQLQKAKEALPAAETDPQVVKDEKITVDWEKYDKTMRAPEASRVTVTPEDGPDAPEDRPFGDPCASVESPSEQDLSQD